MAAKHVHPLLYL